MMLTDREKDVLDIVQRGIVSPSAMAAELGVTISAVSQVLKRLEQKGSVRSTRHGRKVVYEALGAKEKELFPGRPRFADQHMDDVYSAYKALAEVWSHVLRLDLTAEEMMQAREAKNHLEDMLLRKERRMLSK